MTVNTSNIWKSAAAAVRHSDHAGGTNLHIGHTLRDLYLNEHMPKTERTFADLMEELEAAEKAAATDSNP